VGGWGRSGGRGGGRLGDGGGWEGGDAGLGGALSAVECGVRSSCVPPPFTMLGASSLGSNTSCTSPSRTVAPGASGASPFTCSPSSNVPLVGSSSASTHTPTRLTRRGGPGGRGGGGGRGLRRASGRPRWRGGSRSGGRRVRIETKLLVAQPNHVSPGEDPLTLQALLVHERPVGTRVDQQIA